MRRNIGAHDGAVTGATRTSPSCISASCSGAVNTRAMPSTMPGEAAKPLRPPSCGHAAQPLLDRVARDAPQHDREGLVDSLGRGAERRGASHAAHAAMILRRLATMAASTSARGRRAGRPGERHVRDGRRDLLLLSMKMSSRSLQKPSFTNTLKVLASCATSRMAPVLDVEVVVLDVVEHGAADARASPRSSPCHHRRAGRGTRRRSGRARR